MDLETKAHLITVGTVNLSRPRKCGHVSTAGPGAGGQSIFFQSGEKLARISVDENSPLRLEHRPNDVIIFEGESEIARGQLIEPLLHCPNQAYITVSERCIFDCKFCAVPKLNGCVKSLKTVHAMVEEASKTGKLQSISLTSGVEVSPKSESLRVAKIARDLKSFGVPIGVSVSPFPGVNHILKRAGVDEVKYNLETVDHHLFSQIGPGISLQEIMDALKEAVGIFGKNRVFSNVIVGLGESNKTLRHGINELTEMGVLPILRAVFPHPLRVGELEMTRPSKERLLDLGGYLKRSLEKNDLAGGLALTGCYRCTGCDLTPGRDL